LTGNTEFVKLFSLKELMIMMMMMMTMSININNSSSGSRQLAEA